MTLCVICDMLYKSQEGKKKKGHCKAFVAPVDVQLDCDDKTMVQPDILIVCDPDKLIKQCLVRLILWLRCFQNLQKTKI